MDTNEPKNEGYLIIPRSWLKDMAEKQNTILSLLENILKEKVLPNHPQEFKFIPIQLLFQKGICSKPTFYEHLKKGEFPLYKFGNRSYVKPDEFFNSFHKVEFNRKAKRIVEMGSKGF